MPKKAKELSALETNRLRVAGMHAVGGAAGLHLRVLPTGGRTWILRVVVGNKRKEIGLGGFPDVPLAQAREKARAKRELIEQGIDPVEDARVRRSALKAASAAAITFSMAAARYIAAKESGWKNAKHGDQWRNTIKTYAEPVLGTMLVSDITETHVLSVLEPIWTNKTETATRVRGRIESILDWARVRGYRKGENPARWRGHLETLLAKPSKANVKHHPALPVVKVFDFFSHLRLQDGIGARAVEFVILTATRSGEVREADWSEIDLNAKVWTIPGTKMKAKKEHRVALSDESVAMLKSLGSSKGLIFPAPRGGVLSDMTLTAVLRRMSDTREAAGNGRWTDEQGRSITVHGFRSTFRDWAGEKTGHSREVIEHALAHQLKDKAEAAYARGTLFEKRQKLMDDWASYCTTPLPTASNVVPIKGVA